MSTAAIATAVKQVEATGSGEAGTTREEAQAAIDSLRGMLDHNGKMCTCASTFKAVVMARNVAAGMDGIAHDPKLWRPADIQEAEKLGKKLKRVLEDEAKKHSPMVAWTAFADALGGAAAIIAAIPYDDASPVVVPTVELARQAIDHLQGMLTNGTNGHDECATTRGFIVAGKHVAVAKRVSAHVGDRLWTARAEKARRRLFESLVPMLLDAESDDALRRVFQPFAEVTANYAEGFRYKLDGAPVNL